MRIERLSLQGLLAVTDTTSLDFRDLGPGLIAIVGPNRAGKTTILEAMVAALRRRFLTRSGPLHDYASDRRDSFLDVEIAMDGIGVYRARVNVDGLKATSDAVLELFQPNGTRTVLNDGKAGTFDAAVATHFPFLDTLPATSFAAQNRKGTFTDRDTRRRKELFGAILGLEHYQAMSDTARQAATFVQQSVDRLTARRDTLARDAADGIVAELDRMANALQVEGGDAELLKGELAHTIASVEAQLSAVQDAVAAHAAARAKLDAATQDLAGRVAEQAALDRQRDRAVVDHKDDTTRRQAARAKALAETDELIANNRKLLDNADAVRAAVAAVTAARTELAELRTRERQVREAREAARYGVRHRETELTAFAQTRRDLDRFREDAETLKTVPFGEQCGAAACRFLVSAQAAAQQIVPLSTALQGEADAYRDLTAFQTRVTEYDGTLTTLKTQIDQQEHTITTHQRLAALHDKLVAAETRIEQLIAQRAQQVAAHDQADADAETRHQAQLAELVDRGLALRATVATLHESAADASAALQAHAESHARAVTLTADLRTARADWDSVTATLARVTSARSELDRRRAELQGKRTRVQGLEGRIATLQSALVEWQLLAKAFGREGLPVLEMDAAGPTITALVNQLLEVCYGSWFSIELVTQRPKADGKGYVDDFTVNVFDNQKGGAPRDIAELSGGEQVIVAEALMIGIGLYVNTRSAVPIRTAWRDETTGALDGENAVRYFQMLRKLHELGGYHHVFFITHNPEIAAMADAQIQVADGKAAIVLPPYVVRDAA